MATNFNFFAKKNAALLGLGLDIDHGVMSVKWVDPLLQRKQEHTADTGFELFWALQIPWLSMTFSMTFSSFSLP